MIMNKRLKKKKYKLFTQKMPDIVFITIDRMIIAVENKGLDWRTVESMHPIKKYFYKNYGKKPLKNETEETALYRLLCSIDYDILEMKNSDVKLTETEYQKLKSEEAKLEDYYQKYNEPFIELIKSSEPVREQYNI